MITKPKQVTFRAIIVYCVAVCFYIYDFLLQASPGAMSVPLMHDFGISAGVLGSIMGAYFWTYTAFQIPAGLCLDRFGARKIIMIMTFFCATGTLILSRGDSIYWIMIGRLITGAASAFAFLSTLFLIIRWFPAKYFALIAGITQMLGAVGAIFAETPLSYLIGHLGWRGAMLSFAIGGYVLILFVFFVVKDTPHDIPYQIKKRETMGMWQRFKIVISKKQTWPIAAYSFSIWAPIATFAALWGVPFLNQADHLSMLLATAGISIVWAGIAVGSPVIGWLSEVILRRKILLILAAIIGLFSSIATIYFNAMPIWLLFCCLFGIGIAASGQSLSFAVIKDNHTLNTTSAANGLNNMAIVFGGALFQPLAGKLLDAYWHGERLKNTPVYSAHAYHIALFVLPICYIIAIIVSGFLIKETFCKSQYQHRDKTDKIKTYNPYQPKRRAPRP
jgi:MFS family permease